MDPAADVDQPADNESTSGSFSRGTPQASRPFSIPDHELLHPIASGAYGEPKLADAGLVAAVDDARSLVGTAGCIAPEGPGTPQADLYGLGKVLYKAAFGKDRHEFPALPADVASRPDHARLLELNAVLLKACATDPAQR